MKQLQVYSPIKGPTGYEILARDLLLELDKQGVSIQLDEFRNWGPFEVKLSEENHRSLGKALAHKLPQHHTALTHLNICLPEQVQVYENRFNTLYTMFETDNIAESWIPFLENMDQIFVPTDFNHWSFTRNGKIPKEKVKVLPVGYRPEIYNEEVCPLPFEVEGKPIADYPIRFLVVCEITDRKNFWGTLQTFYSVAARIGVDKCCLIMKVGNYSRTMSLEDEISRFRKQLITDGAIPDLPYAVFNYRPLLSEVAHPMFLRCGTHYLSTSLGEGWDLTAMQAAACGLHLFVPMHSAYQCWLNQDCVSFLPITKKMEAAQTGATFRLYQGSNWFAFHLPDTIDLITQAVLDDSIVKVKKEKMKSLLQSFEWSAAIPQYIKALRL